MKRVISRSSHIGSIVVFSSATAVYPRIHDMTLVTYNRMLRIKIRALPVASGNGDKRRVDPRLKNPCGPSNFGVRAVLGNKTGSRYLYCFRMSNTKTCNSPVKVGVLKSTVITSQRIVNHFYFSIRSRVKDRAFQLIVLFGLFCFCVQSRLLSGNKLIITPWPITVDLWGCAL